VLIGETASTGIPITHQSHSLGSLVFGEDGTLLVSTGDGASYDDVDVGGIRQGSSNTALADGILTPQTNVGAFRSQQVDSMNGKILRIDPETGNGIESNPFFVAASPRSARSRTWSCGLRNPFRMAMRPGSGSIDRTIADPGTLYIGDVGWLSYEEINVASGPGMNFGWPLFEGLIPNAIFQSYSTGNPFAINPLTNATCEPVVPFRNLIVQDTLAQPSWPNPCNTGLQLPTTLDRFTHTRPAIEWGRAVGFRYAGYQGSNAAALNVGASGSVVSGTGFIPGGSSSTGGAWYSGAAFPADRRNSYYHADFVGGWIHQFVFNGDDQPTEVKFFANGLGAIVDVEYNPADQSLYYLAFGPDGSCALRRISFGINAPPIASMTPETTFGPMPLTVSFSSAGSIDPEGGSLSYVWEFGDGTTSTEANPVHTYTGPSGPQRFDVKLTVRDAAGNQSIRRGVVSGNNTPPLVTIISPLDGATFPDGVFDVSLRALVNDAEHFASQLSCRWQAEIHHNTHVHPEPVLIDCEPDLSLDGGGHSGETFYWEFRLTVTDGAGLSTVARTSIYPELIDCNGNGFSDLADIAEARSFDCNGDGVPDECTIALGISGDCNSNGIPDECDAGEASFRRFGAGPEDFTINGAAQWIDGRIRLIAPNPLETGSAILAPTTLPVVGFDIGAKLYANGPLPAAGISIAALEPLYSNTHIYGTAGPGYGAVEAVFLTRAGGQQDIVVLRIDGVEIAAAALPFEIADGNPHNVRFDVTPMGARVRVEDGFGSLTTVIDRTRIPRWRVTHRLFGFGASSEAGVCEYAIDDVQLYVASDSDLNANGAPDLCDDQAQFDCDGDGFPDAFELSQGMVLDCNENLRPDPCDISQGFSTDNNNNGVPDECDACPADFNADGGVDGDDVIAFFGAWDAGLISADVDNSGGVDGDDVITFFTGWDSGC
jgi:glucose/arabinose dehydrogenase